MVPGTVGSASATTTAPAQTAGGCDGAGAGELLLPAWGDQAGWANPNQYSTILTADVDGDGTDELIGRNATGLEVFTWGQPFQATASAYPDADPPAVVTDLPAPGQWLPFGDGPGPTAADVDGFYDPSLYTTFRVANLDSDAADELVARTFAGLVVYDYAGGAWSASTAAVGVMADSVTDPWWEEQYYATIAIGDVDGDAVDDVVGRGANGIESYSYQGNGSFTRLDQDGTMADNWYEPQYWGTIRVGDVTGDGAADLIGRDEDGGLIVYTLSSGSWTTNGSSNGTWTDAAGWTNESWYSTIGLADLNGDGTDDIYGRTQYGVDVWSYVGETWTHLSVTPSSGTPTIFTDAEGFDQAPYYSTIQGTNLGPATTSSPDLLLGLDPNGSTGVELFQLQADGTFGSPVLVQPQLSAANGWGADVRAATITTAELAPGLAVLMGKDATGMRTYALSGGSPGGSWVSPSATFPAWSEDDPQMPPGYDPTLWAQQVAAYAYINQQWTLNGGGTGAEIVNIRTAMASTTGLESTPYLLAQPLVWLKDLDPPTGQNIPQDVWDQVWWQTWGWLYQAGNLQTQLFGDTASVQQLAVQAGIFTGDNDPSDVASSYFSGATQSVEAVVLNLLRNVIETAAYAGSGPTANGIATVMSLTGAGLSTYAALTDPTATINAEAEDLDSELADAFCAAQEFLVTAYGNATTDAGLLGAMGQMTIDGPLLFQYPPGYPSPPQAIDFPTMLNTLTDQQTIWVWQQLAAGSGSGGSGGWRVGYCANLKLGPGPSDLVEPAGCASKFRDRVGDGYGTAYQYVDVCEQGIGDLCTYGYQYRVLNTSCDGSDTKGDDAWKALVDLDVGFDPDTLFMPQITTTPPAPDARYYNNSTDPGAYASPQPVNPDGGYHPSGRMGILGWRVVPSDCS
jgi:hypothetical protein